VQRRVELLFARAFEALTQHRDELGARAVVDEHDEAKAELSLVGMVQLRELDEHLGIVAVLLSRSLADARVRLARRDLVAVWEFFDQSVRFRERIILSGKELDEPRVSAEQLNELVDAQLPR